MQLANTSKYDCIIKAEYLCSVCGISVIALATKTVLQIPILQIGI